MTRNLWFCKTHNTRWAKKHMLLPSPYRRRKGSSLPTEKTFRRLGEDEENRKENGIEPAFDAGDAPGAAAERGAGGGGASYALHLRAGKLLGGGAYDPRQLDGREQPERDYGSRALLPESQCDADGHMAAEGRDGALPEREDNYGGGWNLIRPNRYD